MTDKPRAKLSLSLSAASLAKLNTKIPKVFPKTSKSTPFIPMFQRGKKTTKVKASPRRKPHNVLRKDMRTLSRIQYADMWFTLNKNNNVAFPNRRRRAVALKVGIHKDIAKIFKISSPKAYFFLKVYCGSPRYKRAIQITGEPRYNLKGKKVGMVE